MKAWFWQFFSGYVKIKIEGLKLLQLVNDAARQGILLQSAGRESYSRITAVLSWRDYRRLLALAKNRPLRVVVMAQGGLPIIAALALKRAAFTAGLLLCIAALVTVNRFVLDVRVKGCTKPGLEARVFAIVEQQGLRPGVTKSSLDLHKCEHKLMLDLQEVSFAAIRVNGVVATVDIVEGVPTPKVLDKNVPCDITAGRDAVVRKIMVYEGQVKVMPGEAVRHGQVLVDSTVTLLEGFKRVHARADVLASIWYEGRGAVPLFAEKSLRTGAVVERRALELGGFVLPVGEQGPPGFGQYEVETSHLYLLGMGSKGPRLAVTRYFETRTVSREADFDAARQQAILAAVDGAGAALPTNAQIIESRTDYDYLDGMLVAKIYIETLENIAVETPVN